MKTMKLKMVRLAELVSVIDAVPPKDLQTMKDIRLTSNLVKDLQTQAQSYFDRVIKIQVQQNEIVKKYQTQYQEESKNLTDEEKQTLEKSSTKEMTDKVNEFNEQHKQEIDEINNESLQEQIVELDDEKYSKLKELFEKFGPSSYLKKDACLEVAEALQI